MRLEPEDNKNSSGSQDEGGTRKFQYIDPEEYVQLPTGEDGTPLVPAGVLEGIRDAAEGRTMDGDDLDDALLF